MKSMLVRLLIAAAALALVSCASVPRAPQPLSVIVFPGGWNLPIWVAQEKGLFEKNGLDVKVTPTPNSRFQLTGLIEGKFDIAMTAIDNIVAYREGQGGVAVDASDLITVMGGDPGFLRLVSAPDVKSIGELKGKTLSVDALTTGYAFVLLEVLERNGLVLGRDYQTVSAGGGVQRYNDLVAGKHAATLLTAPLDVMAEEKGFRRLTDASQALGRYQGLVAGVRRSWARDNRDMVSGYIKAYADAVEWLYDPKNRDEAIRIFMRNQPGATQQTAETAYKILLNPNDGLQRRAEIDMQGVRTTLELRAKYGKPQKKLGEPTSYYDGSYYEAAMRAK
jgi:ABC-type nitrate/sulfonate/bicarbonate transport system substrate-binding protein